LLIQVRSVLDQGARAMQVVFLFTLAAGMVVLYAAIAATLDERKYQTALLRTLGASRAQLLVEQLAEFGLIGGMAGLTGSAGAVAVAQVLSARVFEVPYQAGIGLWGIGVAGGALGVMLVAYLGLRGVLSTPPLATLQRAG
ncbi:MAG: FtsX-like permease family protein, partial [Burkholderiales bacterium]